MLLTHPSVVTIEANARLNFAKISPSSVRTVSTSKKAVKQTLESENNIDLHKSKESIDLSKQRTN